MWSTSALAFHVIRNNNPLQEKDVCPRERRTAFHLADEEEGITKNEKRNAFKAGPTLVTAKCESAEAAAPGCFGRTARMR